MMRRARLLALAAMLLAALLVTGCATTAKPYDYSAFKRSNPKSILVLPPVNKSPDIKATYSLLAQMSYPLAESGYYVFPVAVVDETFRQNGLTVPDDIHAVAPTKLREIFGADAALYVEITQYGTRYAVVSSDTIVAAKARLVDLKSGETLWTGAASASNNENQNNNNGLIGMLVKAAIDQIVNTLTEQGHKVAGITSQRLLAARPYGVLYGPRSPNYGKDDAPGK
jgi:hypothetical protein